MALVESQRVDAVQAVEPPGEVGGRRLDDHVVVRGHQAEGVDGPAEARDTVGKQLQEGHAVGVVAVDRAAIDPAGGDVKNAVRKLAPKLPCHASEASAAVAELRRLWNVRHTKVAKNRPFSANSKGQTLVLGAAQMSRRASAAVPAARKAAA